MDHNLDYKLFSLSLSLSYQSSSSGSVGGGPGNKGEKGKEENDLQNLTFGSTLQ